VGTKVLVVGLGDRHGAGEHPLRLSQRVVHAATDREGKTMKGLAGGLVVATMLALVSGSHTVFAVRSTHASATTCWAPPEPDRTITSSCFSPSQLVQLERRMPSLIAPSVAVMQTTHLSLTEAILETRHGRPLLAVLFYGDLKFSRPPFPSPARYLGVDGFPGGRYRAYAHRLAVLRDPYGSAQVKGYVPARNLSFQVSAAAPIATLRQIARAIERIGSQARTGAGNFAPH
jgi:hypothetical protein